MLENGDILPKFGYIQRVSRGDARKHKVRAFVTMRCSLIRAADSLAHIVALTVEVEKLLSY